MALMSIVDLVSWPGTGRRGHVVLSGYWTTGACGFVRVLDDGSMWFCPGTGRRGHVVLSGYWTTGACRVLCRAVPSFFTGGENVIVLKGWGLFLICLCTTLEAVWEHWAWAKREGGWGARASPSYSMLRPCEDGMTVNSPLLKIPCQLCMVSYRDIEHRFQFCEWSQIYHHINVANCDLSFSI
jgi:hypothetical protein